jgi:hypothetical protein
MTKYIALPLLAIVAACAAEVENGAAGDRVDNLVVENLIITDSEIVGVTETETQPTVQPAAPPETPAARQSPAQPKEPATHRPAPAAEPKAPAKTVQPKATPPAEPEVGPAPADGSCPPEHREMGHC